MAKPKKGNIGRYVTWPRSIDEWLQKRAKERGYSSPQEFVREIMREARDSDTNKGSEQQAA